MIPQSPELSRGWLKIKIKRTQKQSTIAKQKNRQTISGWLSTVAHNNKIKRAILADKLLEQKCICDYTGRSLDRWNADLDHIIPKSRGGTKTPDNVHWVVRHANRAKQNLQENEFFNLVKDIARYRKLFSIEELQAMIEERSCD